MQETKNIRLSAVIYASEHGHLAGELYCLPGCERSISAESNPPQHWREGNFV